MRRRRTHPYCSGRSLAGFNGPACVHVGGTRRRTEERRSMTDDRTQTVDKGLGWPLRCEHATHAELSQNKTSIHHLRLCIVPFLGLALLHPGPRDGRDFRWTLGPLNSFARNFAAYARDRHQRSARGSGFPWMTLESSSLAL